MRKHILIYAWCAYPGELDLVERERLGLALDGRHPPRRLHPAARRRHHHPPIVDS
jgi:hypothetical protein